MMRSFAPATLATSVLIRTAAAMFDLGITSISVATPESIPPWRTMWDQSYEAHAIELR